MENKKGSTLVWGLIIIFSALLIAIFLGMYVFGFNLVNDALSIDVDLGNGVNLKEVSDATFGQVNQGLVDNADSLGIMLMFGMCLVMILNGYITGKKYPKLFLVADFFILILFFIPAVYVSLAYQTFINSTSILSTTFMDVIPKTSKFVLGLPAIMGTVGILTMILTYAKIKRPDEEPRPQGTF